MSKTLFKLAFLSVLISTFSLADDLLTKISNGVLSENFVGVKKLSEAEMSEVVGGYKIGSVNWCVYTHYLMPQRNKHKACTRPQTLKQPIYAGCY